MVFLEQKEKWVLKETMEIQGLQVCVVKMVLRVLKDWAAL